MNLATNKRIAEMALKHTLQGSTPGFKKQMQAANWDYYRGSPRAFERTKRMQDLNEVDRCVINLRSQWNTIKPKNAGSLATIRQLAQLARRAGCGNCEDMACVAFDYCYSLGARPLELMNLLGVSHAFVCIGRLANSSLGDSKSWGDACYICDPWGAGLKKKNEYGLYPGKDFLIGMSRVAPGFRSVQPVFAVR